jgi:pimeloyl-ACP methyl ester carboxylesterase
MRRTTKSLIFALPLTIVLVIVAVYSFFPGLTLEILVNLERGMAGLEQKSIAVGDWHIEYLEGGEGEVLVLLHGFGGNKDNWTRVARYLTPHFRVIAPDLPGFGESSRDMDAAYTYAAQVDRLHRLVEALGLEKFHLGGNSMGGNIAGNYIARYEDDILSLWLISTGGVLSAQPSEMSRILNSTGENPLVAANAEEFDRLLDFVFVKRPFVPGPIKRHLAQEAIDHRRLNQRIFEQIIPTDADNYVPLEELLKNVQTKTLILWGDQDRVLHVSGGKVLEAAMPNAKAVIMKNIGHLPMVEAPEASANGFLSFIGKREMGE